MRAMFARLSAAAYLDRLWTEYKTLHFAWEFAHLAHCLIEVAAAEEIRHQVLHDLQW